MDENNLYVDALKTNFPYTALYIQKYGKDNLVSTYEIPSKYKTAEELYKRCIKEGQKARDIISIPENVIL